MSDFVEVQFPVGISMGSLAGPSRQTQIVVFGSGYEARNARWLNSRRVYDIGYGLHSENDIHAVIVFFEARNGRLIGFRFKDWTDWKSCPPRNAVSPTDQIIGTGAVSVGTFQLRKAYTSGGVTWYRTIKKPVSGTVRVALDGVEQFSGFTVDTTTGEVSFTVNPGGGVVVTAGFEFDTPVRFDTDKLEINMAEWAASKLQSIPMIELFLP